MWSSQYKTGYTIFVTDHSRDEGEGHSNRKKFRHGSTAAGLPHECMQTTK